MSIRPAWLGEHPIFRGARPESLAALRAAAELHAYDRGALVLAEGESARQIYALGEGAVRVFHLSAKGAEVVVKLFKAPAIFGEAEALGEAAFQENVAVVERASVLEIPTPALLAFFRREPECALRLLMDVSRRLAIAAYNEKSLAFNPLPIRLANFLLDCVEGLPAAVAGERRLPLTQEEMAAALGVTRRAVASEIIAWQREGLLEKRGASYVILDAEGIRRYSDPHRLSLAYSLGEPPAVRGGNPVGGDLSRRTPPPRRG